MRDSINSTKVKEENKTKSFNVLFNSILNKSLNYFTKNLSPAKMVKKLDSMEKISVIFGSEEPNQQNMTLVETLNKAKKLPSPSKELNRRIVALEYRLRKVNGGTDLKRVAPDQMEALLETAVQWVQDQHVIREYSHSTLRQMLHETGNYPLFVDILLNDKELQNEFFNWVIRDGISSSLFIEYPALQKKIVDSNLQIRVNHFKTPGLKIQFEKISDTLEQKIVTLLIEGKEVNILDTQREVQLRGNWVLTIDQVLEIFHKKSHYSGNLEYTEDGIINWNVYEWGYWDNDAKKLVCVNFEEDNWWQSLPLFKTISMEDASRELGHKLDGTNWAVEACASRKYQNLNLFENHAFLKIFFPASNGLGYSALPLGKYAKTVPLTMNPLKRFSVLCDMTPATISFIDENIFYTFREQTTYGFLMTREQGKQFFNTIKRDMLASKENHLVYQIETENCAKWAQETLNSVLGEENVPNLYRTFFLNTEAKGLIGWMMKILRRAPRAWQPWLVTRFHIPLGAFKGSWVVRNGMRHWISIMTLPFWENGMIYFPAFLHHQMERGLLVVRKIVSAIRKVVRDASDVVVETKIDLSTSFEDRATYIRFMKTDPLYEICLLITNMVTSFIKKGVLTMSYDIGLRQSVACPYAIQHNFQDIEKRIKENLIRIFKETAWGIKPNVEELSYLYSNTTMLLENGENHNHYKQVVSLLGEGVLGILGGRQTSIYLLLKFAPKSIQETAIHAILTMRRYHVVKYVQHMILSLAFTPSDENIKKAMNIVLHANGYLNRSNIMLSVRYDPVVVCFSNDRLIELPTFLWGDKLIERVTDLKDQENEEKEPTEKKRKTDEFDVEG